MCFFFAVFPEEAKNWNKKNQAFRNQNITCLGGWDGYGIKPDSFELFAVCEVLFIFILDIYIRFNV